VLNVARRELVCDRCKRSFNDKKEHLKGISYWSYKLRRGRDFCFDCLVEICEKVK